MIEWQHRERDAMAVLRRMSVLQAEIVPGLVHDTRCKFEITQARIGVVAVGEPTVSLGEQRRIGSRAAKSSLGRVGLSRAGRWRVTRHVEARILGDIVVVRVVDPCDVAEA